MLSRGHVVSSAGMMAISPNSHVGGLSRWPSSCKFVVSRFPWKAETRVIVLLINLHLEHSARTGLTTKASLDRPYTCACPHPHLHGHALPGPRRPTRVVSSPRSCCSNRRGTTHTCLFVSRLITFVLYSFISVCSISSFVQLKV